MVSSSLSVIAAHVRQHDRERFVTTLFAPGKVREDLLTLYAFNAETARVKSLAREPLAGMIRLQWWRDMLTGQRPAGEVDPHPVAGPLSRLTLSPEPLLAMLDAREQELERESFTSLAALVAHVDQTAGNLAVAALQVLGCDDENSLRAGRGAGIAYGLVGTLRSIPFQAAQGWQILGPDLSVEHVAAQAAITLKIARQIPLARQGLAVGLQGTLAQGQLNLLQRAKGDVTYPPLARPQTFPLRLLWQAIRGRF